MSKDILIIFLKPFSLGKVKTRLAKDIGDHQALEVYRTLVRHTVQEAQKLFLSGGVELCLCYSEEPDTLSRYPGAYQSIVQSDGNLGDRMHNAIEWAHQEGFRKKIIIGSDCASITVAHLTKAYQLLDENDLVIGPAEDGGYYLIGVKAPDEAIFKDIHWSTNSVYDSTLKNIREARLRVDNLDMLSDIDTLQDLEAAPSFIKAGLNY